MSLSMAGFLAITWTGFVICSIACALRLYIRRKCLGDFLADDWIMMFALANLFLVVVLGQLFIPEVYATTEYKKDAPHSEDFLEHFLRGLRGSGAAMIAMYVGVWAIKLSFLLFFKRLGAQIKEYIVAWYVVLVITVGCGAVSLGMQQYRCIFASWVKIVATCARPSELKQARDTFRASWIVDVVSDGLIICFPIAILWRVRIGLKQKLILTCVFSLVALTIAVTVVRGTLVGGIFMSVRNFSNAQLQTSWVWLFTEYSVSFLIACIVSFRALFVRQENRTYEHSKQPREAGLREQQGLTNDHKFSRVRRVHDSLLESFKALETTDDADLPKPASGRFTPTFLTDVEIAHLPKGEV
ncbi:hypothetical protein BDV96DRAFT_688594 [Lophiotrema nucula]|uniref:Rhodopsin domain-containing protein n=1 Tax=Lophiotrema nucula TaxID=690887 RepID=A0A6A5Z2F7_9PLEO|nr:hypothetical protein BDV96DRAFT_688594 [Lophiotrema nucula]